MVYEIPYHEMMFLHKSNQNTIAFEASSHYAYIVHLAAGHACVWARWPGGLFQHHGGEGWGGSLFSRVVSTHRTGTHPEQPLPTGYKGIPFIVG